MSSQIPMLYLPVPAGELVLRPYQAWSVDELARAKRDGHLWTILCAPTGSGKTEIAIHLIERARKRGMRVAFVCDRRTLVKQTSDRFFQYGIPHGVAMAKKTFGRSMPIQICSVQTIQKRGYWPALDLLVIDEAHTQHKGVLKFAKSWGGPVIGLTATPLTEGLGQWYSKVINAVTTDRLLADGYLAPLKIYAATEIDMAGAKKGNDGEWLRSEVRTRGRPIVGDIVSTYERMTRQHFGGPVKTLLFSADIAHGEELCRAFQAAGHDFRQSSYRDGTDETEAMVEAFRRSEFTGLVSVEKFVKGFDVPDVLCMIGARPYSSSLASVIQQMGRGMRTAEGKDFCLYLDHAGNVAGWYDDVCDIWENGVERLPDPAVPKKSRKEGRERQEVVCLGCRYVLPPKAGSCPYCGKPRSRARTSSTTVPGRMEEWAPSQSAEWMKDESWVWSQVSRLALERTNGDLKAAQGKAAGYYKGCTSRFPKWGRPLKPCDGPVDEEGIEASPTQPDPVRQIAEGRVNPAWDILQGDCIEVMRGMEPESVHCVVTSPPYWGLRNYGVDGAYGLESTLDEYI